MRLIKIAILCCAFAVFIIACNKNQNTVTPTATTTQASASSNATPAAAASPADELADARQTFSQVCARCHKPDGTGGIFKDEDVTLKVPNLHEGHALTYTDEQLARKIAKGGDGMPAFGKRLSPEKINALVRFIHVEFQGQK